MDDGPDDAVAALRRTPAARSLWHACCTPAALQPARVASAALLSLIGLSPHVLQLTIICVNIILR